MAKASLAGKLATLFFLFFTAAASPAPLAERRVLPNGIVLLFSEQRSLPIVTVRLAVKAGSSMEQPAKAGLAHLTAELLTGGTEELSAPEISRRVDSLGGNLSVSAGRDYLSAGISLLREDLDEGLKLLSEILLNPTFPEEEFRRKLRLVRGRIHKSEENPRWVAERAFRKTLFGQHPYGRPVEGTLDSLNAIRRNDVIAFHREHYIPNRTVIALVGDLSLQEAEGAVRRWFGSWRRGPETVPFLGALADLSGFIVNKIDRPLAQAHVLMGHLGIPRHHPDYYTLKVMNYILGGGGFESRLLKNLREKRGLVYTAYSYFISGLHAGHFLLGFQTENSSANVAIEEALRELRRLREEGVTDAELSDAKAYFTGSFPMRYATNKRRAKLLLELELYGLGLDYHERYSELINAVDREAVLRAARKYLHPRRLLLTVVADQKKAALKY